MGCGNFLAFPSNKAAVAWGACLCCLWFQLNRYKNVDLGLVPPKTHCTVSAKSLCFTVPQYSILKIEMQTGGSCKKTASLAPNVPEPLQPVPSDASFSGKGKWIPWATLGIWATVWITDNSSCTSFSGEEDRQDWNSSGAKWITGLFLSLIHSTWAERVWSHEACASFCSS